ncbi:MAG TPA: DUF1566 domain-containing protein [Steroidobacteraceae bacterium]|jgi:hypothetical protein
MSTLLSDIRFLLAERARDASLQELIRMAAILDDGLPHIADTAPRSRGLVKVSAAGALLPESAPEWALVLDERTDLLWSRGLLSMKGASWKAALQTATEFTTAAPVKFRAPTVMERLSICDYSRIEPALDTRFFDSPKSGWEWTATPYAPSPADYAWFVYISYGYSNWSSQYYEGFVRACAPRQ